MAEENKGVFTPGQGWTTEELVKKIDGAAKFIGILQLQDGQIGIVQKGFIGVDTEIGFLEIAKAGLIEETKKPSPLSEIKR